MGSNGISWDVQMGDTMGINIGKFLDFVGIQSDLMIVYLLDIIRFNVTRILYIWDLMEM